jgi:cyclic pyranopterin monophosphate synthase
MRDISGKIKTLRTAIARATVRVNPETIRLLHEHKIPKGDPLSAAKVAAVQAVKNTPQIIPYCHPVPVEYAGAEFSVGDASIDITVTVKAVYKTGVEMEALTGATAAALTIYDMMKMLDPSMEITGVRLLEKRGGSSEYRTIFRQPLRAAVLVMSDTISAGKKHDRSGIAISDRLREFNIEVSDYRVIPDDPEDIRSAVLFYSDEMELDLIMTTGGTGMSPRDNTPEVLKDLIDRDAPGITETLRAYGQERTPYSMLSRGRAGIRGRSLIINLPGSSRGVQESLDALFPYVLHTFKMLRNGKHSTNGKSL